MPFTNEDLKILKAWACNVDDLAFDALPQGKLKTLLARLEAESNCAGLLQLHFESGAFDELDEGDAALIVEALEARRKECGE